MRQEHTIPRSKPIANAIILQMMPAFAIPDTGNPASVDFFLLIVPKMRPGIAIMPYETKPEIPKIIAMMAKTFPGSFCGAGGGF